MILWLAWSLGAGIGLLWLWISSLDMLQPLFLFICCALSWTGEFLPPPAGMGKSRRWFLGESLPCEGGFPCPDAHISLSWRGESLSLIFLVMLCGGEDGSLCFVSSFEGIRSIWFPGVHSRRFLGCSFGLDCEDWGWTLLWCNDFFVFKGSGTGSSDDFFADGISWISVYSDLKLSWTLSGLLSLKYINSISTDSWTWKFRMKFAWLQIAERK